MITERTLKISDKEMGDKYFLEYIDDDTGNRIKQIPLDETEYKHKTAGVLIEGHMKENHGVSYSEALLAVSVKHPGLFSEYIGNNTGELPSDEVARKHKTANALIESHMKENPGVIYGEAFRVVSKENPEFFI